jgi:hypothetical protein
MLLGAKDEIFVVGAIDQGKKKLSASLLHRDSTFKFEMIGLYGPVDHAHSAQFLSELEANIQNWWCWVISTSLEELKIRIMPTLIGA